MMAHRIGSHVINSDGDILCLTVHGHFTLEDMRLMTALADEHATPFGYLLLLNDLTDCQSLSAEARRYSAEQLRLAQRQGRVYSSSASFGTSPIVRGAAALFFAMLRLTSGGQQISQMAKNETDARAFLAERRLVFQAQLKQSKPSA